MRAHRRGRLRGQTAQAFFLHANLRGRNAAHHRLQREPALLPLVRSYWLPWLVAAWSGAMLYFGYSVCRSHGNTRLPGYLMMATSLANIGLDYLYIFEFGPPSSAIVCFFFTRSVRKKKVSRERPARKIPTSRRFEPVGGG